MAVRPLVELSKTDSDEQTHQQLTCDAKATNPNRQVPLVSFIFLLEFCKLTGKQRFTFRLDTLWWTNILPWKNPPFLMGKSTISIGQFSIAFCMFTRLDRKNQRWGSPHHRLTPPFPLPRDLRASVPPWWGNGCRNTSRTSAWSRATWAPWSRPSWAPGTTEPYGAIWMWVKMEDLGDHRC